MTLNRAQRRALKKHMQGQVGTLAHPVPGSVVLRGGPMNGWIVKPGAPALEPDWRAKYLEEAARGAYEQRRQERDGAPLPPWEDLGDALRAGYRSLAESQHGAGRYVLRPDDLEADWVAE